MVAFVKAKEEFKHKKSLPGLLYYSDVIRQSFSGKIFVHQDVMKLPKSDIKIGQKLRGKLRIVYHDDSKLKKQIAQGEKNWNYLIEDVELLEEFDSAIDKKKEKLLVTGESKVKLKMFEINFK